MDKTSGIKGKLADVTEIPAPSALMPFNRRIRVQDRVKRPGFRYRLTRNTPEDIDFREAQGWRVVVEKSSTSSQPDARVIAAGKFVVMEMTEALFQAYRKKHFEDSVRAMRGPEEEFKGKAEKAGFETVSKTRFRRGPMSMVLGEKTEKDD